MSLSRWLDRLFRALPSPARRRRFLPTFEVLEDRVVPATTWVVGTLSDNGARDSLRYILDKDAKAGDLVAFSQSLYQTATGNNPAKITLQQNPSGLAGGSLVVPAGVNVVGPVPDTSRGYEQPLIAIDGSQLSNTAPALSQNLIDMSGTSPNVVDWPTGGVSAGNLYGAPFTQQDSPRDPGGDGDDGGTGFSVVAFLTFENAKANQAAVAFTGGAFAFLVDATVESNASLGIVNEGASNVYVTNSFVTNNGTGAGSAPRLGGLLNQPSAQTTVMFSTFSSNKATVSKYGGGATNQGGSLYLEDSTFYANSSTYGGAGVLTSGGNLVLHSATLDDNQTGAKGGGIMLNGSIGNFTITNTLDAENIAQSANPTYDDIYEQSGTSIGTFFSRFNMIGVSASGLTFSWDWQLDTGDTPPKNDGTTKGTPGTPLSQSQLQLGHLAPNGGPTLTIALLAGSIAIDAGDNLLADRNQPYYYYSRDDSFPPPSGPIPINTDQRGLTRFFNGRQDIGAFEFEPLAAVTITPTTLPNAVPGQTYNNGTPVTLTATGGNNNGFTFAVTTGTLPSWLNLSNSGVLTGTSPVPAGFTSVTFTVTATDSSGNSGSQTYTIANGVFITPAALPTGMVGQAYSQALTANNGTAPYTFSETGTLPNGITFNAATATFSGTPTQAGTFGNIQVTVTDSASPQGSGTQTYTLTIYPALTLAPASGSLPAATTNNLYTENFTAAGGSGTGYTYSETGSLPGGLSFNTSTAQLTGTPTATGTFGNIQVTVTDSAGDKVTNTYSLVVETQITITAPASLPAGTAGAVYTQGTAFTATGGAGSPYTFSAAGLPGGMTLNTSTDKLQGTPTAGGTYSVTVTATDSASATGSKTYTLTINPALTVSPNPLPVATVANSYSQMLTPSGGSGSGYSVTVSGLPSGLSFDPSTDVISGTPANGTANSYTLTVGITDSANVTQTVSLPLTVDTEPSATPTTLPYAAQGGPYSAALSGAGGSGSGYSFNISSGSAPSGISLGSTGQFSGTTSAATGPYNFTVQITDGINAVGTQSFTINVEGPITISPPALTNGTVNTAYNQSTPFSASGGSGSFGALVESGTIPGLTFNSGTDTFTGTPTQVGTFPFTISVTDSAGGTGSQSYNLTIDPAVTLSPPAGALPIATANDLYNLTLVGGGGSGTGYVYTGSGLPGWLSISGSQLTGTPTTTTGSPFSFSITVTDNAGGSDTNNYTLTVDPALTLGPGALPATAQNDPYYVPLTTNGGSGTGYVFSAIGNLPAGLGFSSNVLTGVAASPPGVYNFTIIVTDSAGGTASQNYNLTVTAPISISPTVLPAGTLGSPYPTTTLTATAGSGSGYVYSETGALPGGIAFNNSTGTFSGTPTQYGTFGIQVSATDGRGGTATQSYALVINFSLGASPNALFVDAVYQNLLNRSPDPGAQIWVNMLNNRVAPSTIVSDIEGSNEHLADVVTGIYEQYLGRGTAGDMGAGYWLHQLAHGQSIESVTANILASAEYFNAKGGSNTDFVTGLYNDVLGRAPEAAGLSAWLASLSAGASRYQVALAFLTSTEYRGELVNGVLGWNAYHPQLSGYYEQFLYRTGSAAEQAGWVGALGGGMTDQQVLAAIFGSAEGYRDNS